jgi:hypothetical protein
MNLKRSTTLTLLGLLVITSVSCGLLGELAGRASSAGETAREAVNQAQALATQSHIIRGTAQAFAEQNPALVSTAQAFLKEEGPGLMETARAMATQNPGLLETAQALVDQGLSGDERPDDIPIPEGAVLLYSTAQAVSYTTTLNLQETMDFHVNEMVIAGWNPVAEGNFQTAETAVFNYSDGNRRASVAINHNAADGNTLVVVTLQ